MGRVTRILISGLLAASVMVPPAALADTGDTAKGADADVGKDAGELRLVISGGDYLVGDVWTDVESTIAELGALVDLLQQALGAARTGSVIGDIVDAVNEWWTDNITGNLHSLTCAAVGTNCASEWELDMAAGITVIYVGLDEEDETEPKEEDLWSGPGCGPFGVCKSEDGKNDGGDDGGGGGGGGGGSWWDTAGVDGIGERFDNIATAISDLESVLEALASVQSDNRSNPPPR